MNGVLWNLFIQALYVSLINNMTEQALGANLSSILTVLGVMPKLNA